MPIDKLVGNFSAIEKRRNKGALVDLKDKKGQKVIDEIGDFSETAKFRRLDTTEGKEVISDSADNAYEFGGIDILVNKKPVSPKGPFPCPAKGGLQHID